MSVNRRGAVVIVNAPLTGEGISVLQGKYNLEGFLRDRSVAPGPWLSDYHEDLFVQLKPEKNLTALDTEQWSRIDRHGDLIIQAEELELDAIRILNSCMAQTVNLQYFEWQARIDCTVSELIIQLVL